MRTVSPDLTCVMKCPICSGWVSVRGRLHGGFSRYPVYNKCGGGKLQTGAGRVFCLLHRSGPCQSVPAYPARGESMPITTCIFDAYGTLFDVSAAARQAATEPDHAALADHWPAVAANWRLKQL